MVLGLVEWSHVIKFAARCCCRFSMHRCCFLAGEYGWNRQKGEAPSDKPWVELSLAMAAGITEVESKLIIGNSSYIHTLYSGNLHRISCPVG